MSAYVEHPLEQWLPEWRMLWDVRRDSVVLLHQDGLWTELGGELYRAWAAHPADRWVSAYARTLQGGVVMGITGHRYVRRMPDIEGHMMLCTEHRRSA